MESFKKPANHPIVDEVLQIVTQVVAPRQRASSVKNVDTRHVHILRSSKKKKLLNKKKKFYKKATLTRSEMFELGMFNLPTKSMKYAELVPLHELWLEYMRDHLGLKGHNMNVPTVEDSGYDNFSSLLVKADYHGAKLIVTRSKCPSLVGVSGIVAMDTKQTFKILGEDNKIRTIPKNDSVFLIKLYNLEMTLFGKHLNIRPAERSVKKVKNIMDPDL